MGQPSLGVQVGPVKLFETREQKKNFLAAFSGYVLDAMDFLLYAMVISILINQFHMNAALAGFLSSISLVAASVGGFVFGLLTDFIGRKRVLAITILVYSVASLGAATSHNWQQLLFWRVLLGLGMGGEWGAGMALVVETIHPRKRGIGVSLVQAAWPLGYMLAALLTNLIVPAFTWRGLFVVGVLPAFATWWIQRAIQEPEMWRNRNVRISSQTGKRSAILVILKGLFGPKSVGKTIVALFLCVFGYLGYQAVAIWLPTLLGGSEKMGGFAMKHSMITWVLVVYNLGGLVFFPIFGVLADRFGRKPLMLCFTLAATVITPIVYILLPHNPVLFMVGIFLSGGSITFFAYYGMGISELFPTEVRGSALGFVNNMGRILGGQAPVLIGAISGSIGFAKGMTAIAVIGFLITFMSSFFIHETKGIELQ